MLPGYPARTEKEPQGQPEATSPAAYPTRETANGPGGSLSCAGLGAGAFGRPPARRKWPDRRMPP